MHTCVMKWTQDHIKNENATFHQTLYAKTLLPKDAQEEYLRYIHSET